MFESVQFRSNSTAQRRRRRDDIQLRTVRRHQQEHPGVIIIKHLLCLNFYLPVKFVEEI